MSDEKKKLYLNMLFGYLGLLLLLLAGLRYILITEDATGRALMTFSVMCLGIYFRYVESKLLTNRKEKFVFKSASISVVIILLVIGVFLIVNK